MIDKFSLRLVTAENPYFEGDCVELKIPAHDGMIGICANHAPFVTELGTGVAEISIDTIKILKFAVQNGFIQIADNEVTVVAERVQRADIVSQKEVQNKLEKCREQITSWDKSVNRQKLELEFNWLKALSKLTTNI